MVTNALKREGRFFVLSWNKRNASSKGVDEINSWAIHGTKILYCDWLKAVVRERIPVFFQFSLCCMQLCHRTISLAPASTYTAIWLRRFQITELSLRLPRPRRHNPTFKLDPTDARGCNTGCEMTELFRWRCWRDEIKLYVLCGQAVPDARACTPSDDASAPTSREFWGKMEPRFKPSEPLMPSVQKKTAQ